MSSVGGLSKVCFELLGDKAAVDGVFSLLGWLLVESNFFNYSDGVLKSRFRVSRSFLGL